MKLIMKILLLCSFVTCFVAVSFAQNYKIKQTVTTGGQTMTSTTYVKGPRKRTESGGIMGIGADVATIEQCDLKQNVQVNDKKKMYAVDPFDDGDTASMPAAKPTPAKAKPAPVTKGGTVTYISNITDTGERKQMFGMTARHIKSSMTMESSPDACSKQDMKIETDGWYIDLPAFSCPVTVRPPQMPRYETPQRGGCQDKFVSRTTGSGKMGFPLSETRTMIFGGGMTTTQTTETLEFSKATLDDALFAVPDGYTKVENSQELYGQPDYSAMMRGAMKDSEDKSKVATPSSGNIPAAPAAKRPGSIRIGVLAPTNRGGENISITNMQTFLVGKLTGGNIDAVAVASEADARAASCDYILSSDLSKLKQTTASKVGGLFGKVVNADTSASRTYEAQVDFQLTKLADGKSVIKNKASSKTENNADRAAESVLAMEAAAVLSVAK